MCPDWIIILFSIHIDAFGVEKWRNQLTRPFFPAGHRLAKQDLKPSRSILTHQTKFFGVKLGHSRTTPFHVVLHRDISNDARITSTRVCMQNLFHLEAGLPLYTPIVQEDAAKAPIIHGKGDRHAF